MMRESIYLIVLLNFLNRPLLGNWPTDYLDKASGMAHVCSVLRELSVVIGSVTIKTGDPIVRGL